MGLVAHAEQELKIAGMGADSDGVNKLMHDNIIEVVTVFSKQGHSGFSAGYAIGILEKLLRYQNLRPLSGEDNEWINVSEMSGYEMWQNKRLSSVFKGADGRAYDIDAVVFRRGKDGATFTKGGHRHYITFPYIQDRKVVTIPKWQFWR